MTPEQRLLRLTQFVVTVNRGDTPDADLLRDVAALLAPVAEMPLDRSPELRLGDVSRAMGLSSGWSTETPIDVELDVVQREMVLRGVASGRSNNAMARQLMNEIGMPQHTAIRVVRGLRPWAESVMATLE